MSKVSTIVVGISISISRPLAIVSQAMVSKTVATIVAQTMSIVSTIVVGISSRLGISISRPLAIAIESIAIAESIVSNAIAIAQTMAIEQEGISISLRLGISISHGNSHQAGKNNGLHDWLFLHLVLGGESPC